MATTIVIGASRGIGLALCQALVARGDRVTAVCRTVPAELRSLDVEVIDGIDVTSDASVAKLVERLGDRTYDVLLVAAGILKPVGLSDLKLDTIREQFEVNALGPLHVTAALLGKLHKGSKIAWLTSRMGSLADNGSGSHYGYRMSKAALNMASVSLARDLRSRGIAVTVLHPGFVRTGMTGGNGDVSAEDAAKGLLARIDALTIETSGKFFHANGTELPW